MFKVKNEFGLSGENLEYFQDIEYLKELTKQATALMSRSNAVYNNILNELDVGRSITASPNDHTQRSKSPEDARCDLCGLSHGASYCILKQILSEEELKDNRSVFTRYNRSLSKSLRTLQDSSKMNTRYSSSKSDEALFHKPNKPVRLPIFEKVSPEKLLEWYEMVCTRFGESSGKRFLLAHSLANRTEETIEPWTVPCDARPEKVVEAPKLTYGGIERECFPEPSHVNPLCTDYSEEVRKKVEQLVELRPPCEAEAFEMRKNWKGIFRKNVQEVKKDVPKFSERHKEISMSQSPEIQPPQCKCLLENCDCVGEVTCSSPPKYKCQRDDTFESNYLITIRNKLERRRYIRTMRATTTSRDAQTIDRKSRKPSNFLKKSLEEQESDLRHCLMQATQDPSIFMDKTFTANVDHVADLTSPVKVIDEDSWQNWIVAYDQKEAKYNSDEYTDYGDSDILSEHSDLSHHSKESDLDYKDDQKLFHTRIPYAEEAYRLTDYLFDKIKRKLWKSIHKNTFKADRLLFKPNFAHLMRTVQMLETTNKTFYDISQAIKYFELYSKRLTPLVARRQSKLRRLIALARTAKQADKRRIWCQGIQTGEKFVRPDKEVKYTRDGYLEGFSERRYEHLIKPESYRIRSYNLVGDVRGRTLTKKTIHKDFRFIRNLFAQESEYRRNNLMDEGMKQRLEEYRRKVRGLSDDRLPEPPQFISKIVDTAFEEPLSSTGLSIPQKEEMGVQQSIPGKWQFGLREQRTNSGVRNTKRAKFVEAKNGNKRNHHETAPSNMDDESNSKDVQSVSNNTEIDTAQLSRPNDFGLAGHPQKSSSGVVASQSASNVKRHYSVRSQNQLSGFRRSSASSEVQSIQKPHGKYKKADLSVERQGRRGSHISMSSKRNRVASSLITQESLPPMKNLFDDRITAGNYRKEPSSRISVATTSNRSDVLS